MWTRLHFGGNLFDNDPMVLKLFVRVNLRFLMSSEKFSLWNKHFRSLRLLIRPRYACSRTTWVRICWHQHQLGSMISTLIGVTLMTKSLVMMRCLACPHHACDDARRRSSHLELWYVVLLLARGADGAVAPQEVWTAVAAGHRVIDPPQAVHPRRILTSVQADPMMIVAVSPWKLVSFPVGCCGKRRVGLWEPKTLPIQFCLGFSCGN